MFNKAKKNRAVETCRISVMLPVIFARVRIPWEAFLFGVVFFMCFLSFFVCCLFVFCFDFCVLFVMFFLVVFFFCVFC